MDNIEEKIQAYYGGFLSEEGKQELESWVKTSDENQKTMDELKKVYELSSLDAEKFCPNVDRAWQCVEHKLFRPTKQIFMNHPLFKIAAAVVLTVGLAWVGLPYLIHDNLLSIKTNKGEVREVILDDGTHIWLNSNSSLKYPEKFALNKSRKVYLYGQAYFEVAHDQTRPFKVIGKSAVTEVLGTSFDLLAKRTRNELNVMTGRVAIRPQEGKEIIVAAKNQRVVLEGKEATMTSQLNTKTIAWRFGELNFQSTPMTEVVKVLSKHYQIEFELDQSIENCLITSKFKNKSIEEVLEILGKIANIKYTKSADDSIALTGPSC
ncbi:hypothetical protein BFP72_06985 [Reichenbachiella sp. 5M10]|uniref:FecR family protein n=1 Tax=Reichenbachiella sp. 5M10 TaxID=1889772 RepID=UPI000C14CB39|nr:FecR family protein [Reichenbachiella sp. 5M10]PIB35159.1 hypothetical protein BFP72_06985 [Reichenbachiella sp. 5M10]